MVEFLICWFYILTGFWWIYFYSNINRTKRHSELTFVFILVFWPISVIVNIPKIYKTIRNNLNI
jgi:hypothetical protein